MLLHIHYWLEKVPVIFNYHQFIENLAENLSLNLKNRLIEWRFFVY